MKNHRSVRWLAFLLILVTLTGLLTGAMAKKNNKKEEDANEPVIVYALDYEIEEDGWYSTKEEVAVYLATYGVLPGNYLTKRDAEDLGWVSSWGNLGEVAPGCSIGGNRFGNYEGLLPEGDGIKYTECDIDFDGTYRNAQRIVFSNEDPMRIYYTEDHYESFVEIVVEMELENPANLEEDMEDEAA